MAEPTLFPLSFLFFPPRTSGSLTDSKTLALPETVGNHPDGPPITTEGAQGRGSGQGCEPCPRGQSGSARRRPCGPSWHTLCPVALGSGQVAGLASPRLLCTQGSGSSRTKAPLVGGTGFLHAPQPGAGRQPGCRHQQGQGSGAPTAPAPSQRVRQGDSIWSKSS